MRTLSLIPVLAACAAGAGDSPVAPPAPLDPPPLADGVRVDRVELVQAAPVVLMQDGVGVPSARPIVKGRPGILRAHVVRDGRRADFPVDVVLELVDANGEAETREVKGYFAPYTIDVDVLEDTVNFEFDSTDLEPGMSWSISVFEPEAERVRTGDHERPDSRFPAPGRGMAPLAVGDHDAVIEVFVVPFSYEADGSSRQPPQGDADIAALREQLYKMFPVREVRLTVVPVQPTEVLIEPSGGLGDLLEDLATWRTQAGIPPTAYAYGLVQPADSFDDFCVGACTIGLSYLVGNPNADGLRARGGVGFPSVRADTFVHELGHAHGRRHAPCGAVSNADPDFPNPGGGLAGAGWDIVEEVLVNSVEHKDFMGYCKPRWVSAYQLSAIYEQMVAVDRMSSLGPPTPYPTWTIALREGQAPRVRRIEPAVIQPGGEARRIEVLDGSGVVIREVEGWFYPFGHGEGGTLMVEDVGGAALRLPDGHLLSRELAR
ncbi:MAG: hypothetical protein AB8H79_18180 [Myxococcota bacterium]